MGEVWLPLNGPNEKGLAPKGCNVTGWNEPSYRGIDPLSRDWVGVRLDNWIVIDCDDQDAKDAWLAHIGKTLTHTRVRQTPHGYHFYYKRVGDAYAVQSRKLTMISPKLELKTGVGHQCVYLAPGYHTMGSTLSNPGGWTPLPFDMAWLPPAEEFQEIPEWSEMPEGIADNAMTSFAGTFRRWGMDENTIALVLASINRITMTVDPMPAKTIRRIARQAGKWDPEAPETVECPKCGATWETL